MIKWPLAWASTLRELHRVLGEARAGSERALARQQELQGLNERLNTRIIELELEHGDLKLKRGRLRRKGKR